MSMHGRNDRSVQTDAKRIKENLTEHNARMREYVERGLCLEHASKRAFNDMRGRESLPSMCVHCSEAAKSGDVS